MQECGRGNRTWGPLADLLAHRMVADRRDVVADPVPLDRLVKMEFRDSETLSGDLKLLLWEMMHFHMDHEPL